MSFSHDICPWNGTNFYLSFYSKINVSTSYINNLRISSLLGCGCSQLSYDGVTFSSAFHISPVPRECLQNARLVRTDFKPQYGTIKYFMPIITNIEEKLEPKVPVFFFHSKDRMRVVETKLITYQMDLRHPHTASVCSLRIEDNPEMFSICCLIIARIMILLSYNSKLQCWNFYDSEENEIYKIKVSLSFF